MTSAMSDILQLTESIARQAGNILREGYGNVRHVQQKGAIDLVTAFAKRSEEVILSAMQREFPGHAILAEESGRNGNRNHKTFQGNTENEHRIGTKSERPHQRNTEK